MSNSLAASNANNTLTLAGDWTNAGGSYTDWTITPTFGTVHICSCYHWPCTCRVEVKKVRLKLSEIEKLRAAAKKNPALKPILSKFTEMIEVEVDFP